MPLAESPSVLKYVAAFVFLLFVSAGWTWALVRLGKRQPLVAAEPFPQVPWGLGSVVLVMLLYLALQVAVALGVELFVGNRIRPSTVSEEPPSQAFLVAVIGISAGVNALMILLVPLLLRNSSRATLRQLGLTKRPLFRDVAYGVLAYPLLVPFIFLIHEVFSLRVWNEQKHPMELMLRSSSSPAVVALAIISAIVLAPIAEELMFRGVFQGWLTRFWSRQPVREPNEPTAANETTAPNEPTALSEATAPNEPTDAVPDRTSATSRSALPNVVTSLLFAGVHWGQWPAPLALFVLSLGLGYLYQRTGRLTASIALHALFNGVSTMALLAGFSG